MNKEVLISMVNSGKIRFIPLRRCSLCNEYIGYKFVRMYDGNTIPVFSSGCRCCGINIGTLSGLGMRCLILSKRYKTSL